MDIPQTTLILYVDDLQLYRPTEETITWGTEFILNFLDDEGYKVMEKTQLCQMKVLNLGLVLSQESGAFGPEWIQPILILPLPKPPIESLLGRVGMLQDLDSWIQRATKPPLSGSQEDPWQKVLTKQNGPQDYQGTLPKLKET